MNTKFQLEQAIISLESLLSNRESQEDKYQEFFENNTIAFTALGYRRFYSFTKKSGRILPRDSNTGLQPEPDFIAENDRALMEIFEIKTSVSKKLIVDSNEYRERFTAEVMSYIEQTIIYENYFTRNPENRRKVKEVYGIDIQEDLDIKLVIGRSDHIDNVKVHQKARQFHYKIDIITYDDVLNRLKAEYQQNYGVYEALPGLSFHFMVRLKQGAPHTRRYFFDFGRELEKNRVSFYLDENDDFCFEVTDNSSKTYRLSMDSGKHAFLDEWVYLACDFGKTEDGFVMTMRKNGEEVDRRVKNVLIDVKSTLENGNLGCGLQQKNFGTFDSAETQAYDGTLTFKERHDLLNYYMTKYNKLAQVRTYVQFDGRRYMYRSSQGNFVQERQEFAPIFRKEPQ